MSPDPPIPRARLLLGKRGSTRTRAVRAGGVRAILYSIIIGCVCVCVWTAQEGARGRRAPGEASDATRSKQCTAPAGAHQRGRTSGNGADTARRGHSRRRLLKRIHDPLNVGLWPADKLVDVAHEWRAGDAARVGGDLDDLARERGPSNGVGGGWWWRWRHGKEVERQRKNVGYCYQGPPNILCQQPPPVSCPGVSGVRVQKVT